MAELYIGSEIKKWSIVLDGRRSFEAVRKSVSDNLKDKLIKDMVSIILLNEEQRYIEEEWYLPTKGEPPQIFTVRPETLGLTEDEAEDDD